MPQPALTGPEPGRPGSGPVKARYGMFTGIPVFGIESGI